MQTFFAGGLSRKAGLDDTDVELEAVILPHNLQLLYPGGRKQAALLLHQRQFQHLPTSVMDTKCAIAAALHKAQCDEGLSRRHVDWLHHRGAATRRVAKTLAGHPSHLAGAAHPAICWPVRGSQRHQRFDGIADGKGGPIQLLGNRAGQHRPSDRHGKHMPPSPGTARAVEVPYRGRKP